MKAGSLESQCVKPEQLGHGQEDQKIGSWKLGESVCQVRAVGSRPGGPINRKLEARRVSVSSQSSWVTARRAN